METLKFKSKEIIGRTDEIAQFQAVLNELEDGKGKTIIVSGEAGIGKTRLINGFKAYAESKNIKCLTGTCVRMGEPYLPFLTALTAFSPEELFTAEHYLSIDEAFIINNAGMLLAHSGKHHELVDEDILSGMLTAVQDFVKDGFTKSNDKGTLGKLEYMDTKILIEHGKNIYVAGLVRGEEATDMRNDMKKMLEDVEQKYCKIMGTWDGDLSKVKDINKHLFRLLSKKYPSKTMPEKSRAEAERFRLFEKVAHLIASISDRSPLLLLLEDLHWADESSILLLEYLSRNIKNQRTLIYCTCRPEEMDRERMKTLRKMKDENLAQEIHLPPLTAECTIELVESYFPSAKFSEKFSSQLYRKTNGNPFYVKELSQTFYNEGVIKNVNEKHWQISTIPKIHLPSSITDAVSRRIDRLTDDELKFVEHASVIGRQIPIDLLSISLSMDGNTVVDILSNLEANKILHVADEKNRIYQFDHEIIRDVVYNGISERWKQKNHRNVGASIEQIYKDSIDDVIYQLAYHFSKGDVPEKAVIYSLKAGDKSSSLYAQEDAKNYYKIVLDSLNNLPDTLQNKNIKIEVMNKIAYMYYITGDLDMGIDYAALTGKFARETKNQVMLAESYRNIGMIHIDRADYDRAIEELGKALKISESVNDTQGLAEAHYYVGEVCRHRGKLDEAMEAFKTCLNFCQEKHKHDILLIAKACMGIGIIHDFRGEYNEAIESYKKSLGFSEDTGDKYEIARAYNNIGAVYAAEGYTDKAIKYYMFCIKICEEAGIIRGLGYGLSNIAEEYIKKAELDKAKEYTGKALASFEKLGEKRMMSALHRNYGIISKEKGEWSTAITHFLESIKIAKETEDMENLPQTYFELGMMYEAMNDRKNAIKHFGRAIRIYKKQGNKRKVEEAREKMEKLQ